MDAGRHLPLRSYVVDRLVYRTCLGQVVEGPYLTLGAHTGHLDVEADVRSHCRGIHQAGDHMGSRPSGSRAGRDARETEFGTAPFGPWGVGSIGRLQAGQVRYMMAKDAEVFVRQSDRVMGDADELAQCSVLRVVCDDVSRPSQLVL
jgi:hypothetical protein